MAEKQPELTERAEILLKVLDWINRDQYDEFERYLIFGGNLTDLLLDWDPGCLGYSDGDIDDLRKAKEIGDAVSETLADVTERRGRAASHLRTSLKKLRKDSKPLKGMARFKRLSQSPDTVEELCRNIDPGKPSPAGSDEEWDQLDAACAKEVLGKLSEIVRRVSALRYHRIPGIRNEKIQRYFEEAHRCYAYGFPVACAVLCRAVIESALREQIDSLHSPGHPTVVSPRNATADPENLKRLIDQAKDEIPLSSEAWLCANDVRDAGNCAVHPKRYKEFLQLCEGDKIGLVVANTRKVLQELYRREETR